LCAEYILVTQAFDIEPALQRGGIWSQLVPLRHLGLFVALGAAGTGLAIGRASRPSTEGPSARTFFGWHVCAYLAFVVLTWVVLARSTAPPGPPLLWLAAWGLGGVLSSALLLAAVLGPGIFTLRSLGACAIGASVGAIGYLVGEVAKAGWLPLAAATLVVVYALLEVVFSDVVVDRERYLLGVGDFVVEIAPDCGGYEGVGLVAVLIPTFLAAYRKRFRFPHALLLLPIGMLAVWFGNVGRIATLIAVGALFDPELAVGAFHSKIGWVFFTAVTLGVAALGYNIRFFAKDRDAASSEVDNPAAPYLLPLLALMATALVTSAFADAIDHLYALRMFVAVGVLLLFRRVYRAMDWRISWRGPALGVAVALAWLAPFSPAERPLVAATVSTPWLVARVLGSALVVPLCEELAFRGYLLRRLQSGDFTSVSPRAWTWFSLIVSSLVFGVLHGRWLAGSLAGLAYAVLLVRTGRLGEAVVAHAATNALIALWVLTTGDWSHWL
jgi:exosortase E/protease (VPEID-CTERM system)